MDDLDAIRGRIRQYADYGSADGRHESDKQVRAYLGEVLAAARERLAPHAAVTEQLDALLLRCEFTDQALLRAADQARFDADVEARIHAADRRLLDLADHLRTVADGGGLATLLDEAAAAFEERARAFADAPARSGARAG